jgi:hypothetical protein
MKTIVTLTKVFKKEVKIEVDKELLKGMSEEQIHTFLTENYNYPNEDKLFDEAEFIEIGFSEDSLSEADTNRFDIKDENGNNIYGGHI